jgi:competence protein ComEA
MKKKSNILHGISMLAFIPLLSMLFCGCRKADSTLLLATQQENGQEELLSGEENSSAEDSSLFLGAESGSAEEGTATETDDISTDDEEGLYIYICGEVTNPGVYILDAAARLCDAVEAAGGMTESASRTYWNLAMQLSDGQMIYVPTMEEAAERDFSPLAADGTDVPNQESEGIAGDGRVDINKATKEQLMTIPGIGEAKADSIIAYREASGAYASIEDIMKVSGIKDGLFQNIKEYITVD